MNRMRGEFKEDGSTRLHCRIRSYHLLRWEQSRILGVAGLLTGKLTVRSAYFVNGDNCPMQQLRRQVRTHRGKVLGTAHRSRQQTAFAKHQSWPMVKPVLLAALVCAAPVCLSSAQDAKVSVDMMGIGGMSCAHWQSTQALRSEGTIWIYGFWTGLNYVAPIRPASILVTSGARLATVFEQRQPDVLEDSMRPVKAHGVALLV